jgi:hypothetical protein
MKSDTRTNLNCRPLLLAAVALVISAGAFAQQGGGRPASAGGARPMSTMPPMPARPPDRTTTRAPVTLPEQANEAASAENAASAETTVEHTEDGIVRTTTVTNKHGTKTGSTTVSRDEATGARTVTNSETGFNGETRTVEGSSLKNDEADETEAEETDDPPES